MNEIGFLAVPPESQPARELFDADLSAIGYVMNVSRLWAYQPKLLDDLYGLMGQAIAMHEISTRRRGVIVVACASAFGDSYCSVAWGAKLAKAADADTAAAVLTGQDTGLREDERVLARWARKIARDPNATTHADVQELRDVGFTDAQIFAITVFIGLRITLSTVNDALGAQPDTEFRTDAPAAVLNAVTFGRPIA